MILAVLARPGAGADAHVDHLLALGGGLTREPGDAVDQSITRWKRSRSLSITMSKGVVVVPSPL